MIKNIKEVASPQLKRIVSSVLIIMISIAGCLGNTAFAASGEVKYTYDESRERTMKNEGGKKTYYISKYYEEDSDGTTRKHVYSNGVKVSTITTHPDKSVSTVYHHTDHLGGSNVSTDSSGKVVEVNDYYPYGSSRIEERAGNYENNKLYTGKELDRSSELYYYGARYYDPLIGRFTSVDPWGGDISDPQSLNKYAYVRNNPLKYVDPTGETPDSITDPFFVAIDAGRVAFNLIQAAGEGIAYTYSTIIGDDVGKEEASKAIEKNLNEAKSASKATAIDTGLALLPGVPALAGVSQLINKGDKINDAKKIANETVGTILEEATKITKKKSTQYLKKGGLKQAKKDFKALVGNTYKKYKGDVKSGTAKKKTGLPDGTKINVRPKSSSGKPTLEIQKPKGSPNKTTKIRYEN